MRRATLWSICRTKNATEIFTPIALLEALRFSAESVALYPLLC